MRYIFKLRAEIKKSRLLYSTECANMKYIFTSFLTLFLFVNAQSQSLSVVSQSSDSIEGNYFTELEAKVTVENTSATTNDYRVERFELDMTPGHSSYFCWSIDCYSSSVSLSTSIVTLAQGERDSTFIGYLTPYDGNGGIAGTSVIKYLFFNENDNSDTISRVFVYTANPFVGIQTRVLNENDFYAYPNPTVNTLNIAFGDINGYTAGKIIIRNVLGSELINKSININSNLSSIDVSSLERGVYFYTVQLDGQKFQTKKFAVSK